MPASGRAGTGKTRTLVARIEHLLDAGTDPRNVLVLTFSNKAAGELVERVSAVRPGAAADMRSGPNTATPRLGRSSMVCRCRAMLRCSASDL
ncbi:hypothetical protein ASG51_14565 [Methylobacterium sp. Leaf465]|uniref:UvrD-helicase domain-containing protein n=1 Tax=Methylobacterium sp. Leaf465 TaxID=1736385 RepID=UPI0006F2DF9C|nr:UvrD-helicase domain-containing protein [Methylobacterium sp. Leaf465]KQT70266.1 hypothetical protein ASG51_14565 [Methylobacterium sp. Leaf465]